MTRDKVLKLMNLIEEEFKEYGASVEDMKPGEILATLEH